MASEMKRYTATDDHTVLNFPVSDDAGTGASFQRQLVPGFPHPFYRLADADYACYTRSEPGKYRERLSDARSRAIMVDAVEEAGGWEQCHKLLSDRQGEPHVFTTWPIVLVYISIQSGKVKLGKTPRSTFADNTVRALLEDGHQTWLSASDPDVQEMFAEQALPPAVEVSEGRESPADGNGPPTPEAPGQGQAGGHAVGQMALSDPKGKGKARAAPEAPQRGQAAGEALGAKVASDPKGKGKARAEPEVREAEVEESTQFYSSIHTEGAAHTLMDMGGPNGQAIGGDGAGPSRVARPDAETGVRRSSRHSAPTVDNQAKYPMYKNKPLPSKRRQTPPVGPSQPPVVGPSQPPPAEPSQPPPPKARKRQAGKADRRGGAKRGRKDKGVLSEGSVSSPVNDMSPECRRKKEELRKARISLNATKERCGTTEVKLERATAARLEHVRLENELIAALAVVQAQVTQQETEVQKLEQAVRDLGGNPAPSRT